MRVRPGLAAALLVWLAVAPVRAAAGAGSWESTCREPVRIPAGSEEVDPATGARIRRVEADVDGDGRSDRFQVTRRGTLRRAELELADGRRFAAEADLSWSSMLHRIPVPSALQAGGADAAAAAARAWIETVLFTTVCERPDPSLAWLLREPRRLVWEDGPPPRWMPSYALVTRDGDEPDWLYYRGADQMYEPVSSDPNPTGVPPVLGRGGGDARGPLALVVAEHGVILLDRAPPGPRYAWVYVLPDGPALGARQASTRAARFVADEIHIDVQRAAGERVTLRVNLADGTIVGEVPR